MKKRSILMLVLLVLTLTLTACSPDGKEYLKAVDKVQSWEAIEQEGTVVINVKMPNLDEIYGIEDEETAEDIASSIPENYKITMDIKGFTNNDVNNLTAKINMNMKDESGLFNFKDIEMLMNKDTIYLSRNYVEAMLSIDPSVKVELPENIKYFTMDSGLNSDEYAQMIKMYTNADFKGAMLEIFEALGLNVDVKKDNNTYTIELTSNQILDLAGNAFKNFTKNSNTVIDKIVKTGIVELDEEDIAMLKEEFSDFSEDELKEIDSVIAEVKPYIEGSKFKTVETITDDKYDSKLDMTIAVKDFFNMDMTSDIKSKKAAPKVITFPKAEETKDYYEFIDEITPDYYIVDIDLETKTLTDYNTEDFENMDKAILIRKFDNVEMYGFRTIFEALKFEVGYDKSAKKPYYVLDDKNVLLDLPIFENKAYISLKKMEELGLDVYYDEEFKYISISYLEKILGVNTTE